VTKPRPPVSIDAALARIAGHVEGGYAALGAACSPPRQAGTVRAWGDPDRPEQIPVDCAIAIDLLYREHGGEGAPIHETYTLQLELAAVERFGDRHALARIGADVVRETSEVSAAIIEASLPSADANAPSRILREGEEAISIIRRAMAVAQRLVPGLGRAQPGSDQEAPP